MTCTRRHVVVIGTSSGIGRATALRLAAAGCHVYAGVRRPEDAPPGKTVTPLLLDVTNTEQIRVAVDSVAEHVGPAGLNALVDNAGIGVAVPMELIPLESLRRQLEVNVVDQVAVTQAFLPLLRQARGRVVVIGSIGDRFTPPFGGSLAASKSAIASIADAFRQELAPWDINVVLLEPASIHTDAIDKLEQDSKNAATEFSPRGAELYRDAYLGMVAAALKREQKGRPPDVVAEKVEWVLTASRARARYLVGKDSQTLSNLMRFLPTSASTRCAAGYSTYPSPFARRHATSRRSQPMNLANQEQVAALDPEFGRMAAEVGMHAWSLPQLTMREKTFVFLAADLCTANVGFPLLTHIQMAGANGVSLPECGRHPSPHPQVQDQQADRAVTALAGHENG
jgi:NAD(P)-dependent dehydrogenase (short-subunit alcohol dehydrogenase family)